MIDFTKIKLTRHQLALFLPNHESIKEFERLFAQDAELSETVNNIIIAVGLSTDGIYIQRAGSNYLNGSASIYEDSTILDDEIYTHTRELITKSGVSLSLSEESQAVLIDATSGVINVTLPDPALCFDTNRSRKISVHKIDASTNAVNILPNGTELVAGASSQTLKRSYEILNFITDGTNWYLGS